MTAPTLVVYGAKSPAVLQPGLTRAGARCCPNAELRELAGVSHNVKMRVLAPVVADFITGETRTAVPRRADARHASVTARIEPQDVSRPPLDVDADRTGRVSPDRSCVRPEAG